MRLLLFHLALVGNIVLATAALDHPELIQGSLCFTYLSTYLAPVQTWAASLDTVEFSSPAIDRNQTSTSIEALPTLDFLDSSSLESPTLPIDDEDVPTQYIGLLDWDNREQRSIGDVHIQCCICH